MNATKMMITTLTLACLTMASALAEPTSSAQASKSEALGLGSGLVVGALAGGPVGAIMGAAAGALLGDRMHRDAQSLAQLEDGLAYERSRRGELDMTLVALRSELSLRERMLADIEQTQSRIGETLEFSVLFRTNDTSLAPAAVARLERLGRVLADIGDVEIRVEGHADPRGEDPLNDALSAARAETVKAVLLNAGLSSSQVVTVAHGSRRAQADPGDVDGYALDRRVDIRMTLDPSGRALARSE